MRRLYYQLIGRIYFVYVNFSRIFDSIYQKSIFPSAHRMSNHLLSCCEAVKQLHPHTPQMLSRTSTSLSPRFHPYQTSHTLSPAEIHWLLELATLKLSKIA